MKKKLLSVLLVVCMVLTLMPMTALADFADTEGHWGKNAIDRWAAEGVLNGKGEDVFDPNGNMTRAEFAQMLCNLMGYTKKAENTFADVPDDAWYADAILKLVEAGVLNGVGNNMAAPNAPITREMAAVMLCRAFDLKASSASMSFSDANQVSGWAAGAVAALTEKGMMNGVGDNKVAPQLNINRASVATLIDNMVADYVTGDKTITGEVNGIIVVAGDAKVTFEDATVTAPVIVAPAAEGAEVELTGTTTAENVVVAAEKAAVTVGKDASAETVTAAAKAEVKVEGKVDAVEVTGEDAKVAVSGTAESVAVSGEGAKVDVSGSVGTVSTEAANTSVAVSGTVEKVEVAEGADKTEITAASGAKIDSVTTSAEDVKVSGSGEVGSVTADNGSVDVTTKGTEVKNEGADSVTAGSTTVEEGETATSDGTTGSSSGGSSGGSSSTAKGDYKVTVTDVKSEGVTSGYGSVKASKTAANEGDEITLTVTVNAGYKLSALTVKSGEGEGTAVDGFSFNEGDVKGSYTFIMPGADVTVTATFEALEEGQVTVTFKDVDNSTISTVTGTKGQEVNFPKKSAPDGYWVSGKWKVDGVDELAETTYSIPETFNANSLTIKAEGLQYKDKTSSTKVRPVGPATGWEGNDFDYSAAYGAAGIGYINGSGKITVNLGTTDTLFAASKADGESKAETLAKKQISALTHGDKLYIGVALEAPSGATKAYLNDKAEAREIPSSKDGFDFYQVEGKTYFIDYYAAVKASDGAPLDPITYTAPKVVWLKEDGTAIQADTFTVSLAQASGGDYKKVTVSSTIKNGKVVASPMTVKAGETVTLTVTPDEGYDIKEVKYGTTVIEPKDEAYSFEMPDTDVTVTATFEAKKYNVDITKSIENGDVTIKGGTGFTAAVASEGDEEGTPATATVGTKVTVTAKAKDGYELDKIEVKDADNNSVPVRTSGEFTMPAANVTVSATFRKIQYTIKYMDGTTAITDVGGATATAEADEEGNIVITTLPTMENTATKYYTGWKSSTTLTTGEDGKVTVTKPKSGTTITLTATSLTIGKQTAETRPATGPAEGEEGDGYSYADAYTKIGLSGSYDSTKNTFTISGALTVPADDETVNLIPLVRQNNKIDYIFYGIKFPKPTGATKVVVATGPTALDAEDATIDLTEDSVGGTGSDVLGKEYIRYVAIAKCEVSEQKVTGISSGEDSVLSEGVTYYFKWIKEEGEAEVVTAVTSVKFVRGYTYTAPEVEP